MPAKLVTYDSQNYAGTLGSGLATIPLSVKLRPRNNTEECLSLILVGYNFNPLSQALLRSYGLSLPLKLCPLLHK